MLSWLSGGSRPPGTGAGPGAEVRRRDDVQLELRVGLNSGQVITGERLDSPDARQPSVPLLIMSTPRIGRRGLSVPGDRRVVSRRHTQNVMCDTLSGEVAKCLRPGNFTNVIQNIWYPCAMSDTRCSVPMHRQTPTVLGPSRVGRSPEIQR